MTTSYGNRIRVNVTSTGTGTASLGSAVSGFLDFSSLTSGTSVGYAIDDGANWEVGVGTYTSGTPSTVTRTAIESSSNSGAAISLSGSAQMMVVQTAAQINNPSINWMSVTTGIGVNGASGGSGGISFGSTVGSSNTDLSKHLALWGTGYGLSITSGRLNYNVDPGGRHVFLKNGADVLSIDANGVNGTIGGTTPAPGTFTTLTASDSSTSSISNFQFSASSDTNGVNLRLLGNGATTPSKTIRVLNGQFQVINDAYSASLLTLTDAGVLTVGSISNTPISGSTGSFTTLSASSTVSGAGFTTLLSPYAPLASPALTGSPTAPTQTAGDNSTKLATTAYVQTATQASASISTTGGSTTLTATQYSVPILLVTGTLTSNATLVVPNTGMWTVSNGTTGAFSLTVKTSAGTGVTIDQGQIAEVVANGTNVIYATASGTSTPLMDGSASAGSGSSVALANHVHPTDTSRAPLASPTFTGTVTVPGAISSNSSGFNLNAASGVTALSVGDPGAGKPGLQFSYNAGSNTWSIVGSAATNINFPQTGGGTVQAPTAAANTNTTQIATTAFVVGQAGTSTPNMDGTAAVGTSLLYARQDHTHPTDTSRAPIASPTFTGTLTAPTVNIDGGTIDGTTIGGTTPGAGNFTALNAQTGNTLNTIGRNKFHNPLFNIAQRGAGPFTTLTAQPSAVGYTLDRWQLFGSTDTVSVSQVALSAADRTAIGDEEAWYCLQNTFTGNSAAGAYNLICQKIENVRRMSNKWVCISFWAKASSGTPKIGVSVDQNAGTGGSPVSVNNNGTAFTLSTTWTRYTYNIFLGSIASLTLGTNGNDCVQVNFWFSSGSTNNTRAGAIGVQGATIQLWGMQCELTAQTTPTALEKPDPRYDLSNCQRFYIAENRTRDYAWNSWAAGGWMSVDFQFPTTMRATPSTINWLPTGTPTNYSSASIIDSGAAGFMLQALSTAAGAAAFKVGSWNASADL